MVRSLSQSRWRSPVAMLSLFWLAAGTVAATLAVAQDRPANVVRIATFNVQELNWPKLTAGAPESAGTHPQVKAAAAILQHIRPDIVLLNEIDYTGTVDSDAPAADGRDALRVFCERYLAVSQAGEPPLSYGHRFYRASNTGMPSGIDFNADGKTDGPNDAFGFGRYPGEYAMALLSRFPLNETRARTFRKLLWRAMPGHLMPDGKEGRPKFYTDEDTAVFRLSSKSHWEVPVALPGFTLHLLCSHPTPPVFDGAEDAHGRRNHDELRFWKDYLTGGTAADWIVDDQGRRGGLATDVPFVVLGDLNSDPLRSEAEYGIVPIDLIRKHPRVLDPQPQSTGALTSRNPKRLEQWLPYKTSDFGRLDYVLPSRTVKVSGSGVFWPAAGETLRAEAETASDHRLVWLDVEVPAAR